MIAPPPRLTRALATLALLVAPLAAQDPTVVPYTPTLTYGTGLVNTPVAWVSPGHGDLWVTTAFRGMGEGLKAPTVKRSAWDLTLNAEAHLWGRVALGGSIYSTQNQQVGAFAQLLLLTPVEEGWRPSLAVGVRGLGMSARQDRFVTGGQRVGDQFPGGRSPEEINGNPSPYVVATKEIGTGRWRGSASVGYGTGLFQNDGGMGAVYNPQWGSSGVFGGGRLVWLAKRPQTYVTTVVEHDGWDMNAGIIATIARLSVGVMFTELEEQKGTPSWKPVAGFTKAHLTLGYNGNLGEIVRGSRQRSEAAELELDRQRLRREVAQREARMKELNARIAQASAKADAEAATQRKALEAQLEAEREAMRKAAERLDKTKKPGGTP